MRLRTSEPVSNDNGWEPPVVHRPVGRPHLAYARSLNVVLPLRFARQMPEWTRERPQLRPLERVWRARAAQVTRTFNRLFSK